MLYFFKFDQIQQIIDIFVKEKNNTDLLTYI